jgi:hypothetical protein
MSFFDDKKFDDLDWISQATEPIESPLNLLLSLMPDELVIDYNMFNSITKESYSCDIDIGKVIAYLLKSKSELANISISWEEREAINNCFELRLSEEVILNYEEKTLTGTITFAKIRHILDDEVLKRLRGKEGLSLIRNLNFPQEGLARCNDIMELLTGCEEGIKSRSHHTKRSVLSKRLDELFKNNEWNIKDTVLANKVGHWIEDYVRYGGLASYANF